MDTTSHQPRPQFRVSQHLLVPPQPEHNVSTYGIDQPPIGSVELIDGLRLQTNDPEHFRALADAFEEAARELQEAALDYEARGLPLADDRETAGATA